MRSLLGARGRGFQRYWLAALVSSFGTWAATLALAVRMYDHTHSSLWVGALFAAEFVPPVVIGLGFGHLLARCSLRTLLISSDLARAALFGALVFISAPLAVVALATLVGVAGGFFRPAVLAGLPDLVDEADLEPANAAFGVAENAATLGGFAVGGVLIQVLGARFVLGANAVSFVASAALFVGIAALAQRPEVPSTSASLAERVGRGFRLAWAAPEIRAITVAWTTLTFAIGATNAVEVPYLRGTLHGSGTGVGICLAMAGAGLLGGNVIAAHRPARRWWPYLVSIAVIGASWGALAGAGTIVLASLAVTVCGVANGVAMVVNQSTVQRHTTSATRAQLFAFLVGIAGLATASGAGVGGAVADALSPRWVLGASGALALAFAVPAGAWLLRGVRLEPEPVEGEAAALR